MNPQDIIVTALTPGTPFNEKGLIYRSVNSLAAIVGLPTGEVMGLLAGDLAGMVSCKPSKKGKGLLVALKANIPADIQQPAPAPEPLVAAFGEALGFGVMGNVPAAAGNGPIGIQGKLEAAVADDIDVAEGPAFDHDDYEDDDAF